jgi:predicted DNA-binding transcriptional regulator YafY
MKIRIPTTEIEFDYVNYRGETSHRRARVGEIMFAATEWHTEPQWLIGGFDLDKNEMRHFAMRDMTNTNPLREPIGYAKTGPV